MMSQFSQLTDMKKNTSFVVLRLEPNPETTASRMDVVDEALVALTAASGLRSLQGHNPNLADEWNRKVGCRRDDPGVCEHD
jgi:hypothetical protein